MERFKRLKERECVCVWMRERELRDLKRENKRERESVWAS